MTRALPVFASIPGSSQIYAPNPITTTAAAMYSRKFRARTRFWNFPALAWMFSSVTISSVFWLRQRDFASTIAPSLKAFGEKRLDAVNLGRHGAGGQRGNLADGRRVEVFEIEQHHPVSYTHLR